MELRSSRSRSHTPLLQTSVQVRTTRRTTVKSYENVIATENSDLSYQSSKPLKMSSSKSQRARYKTSDYSSEEGEGEVSSTHTSENTRNQLIEETRKLTNGKTGVSALKMYKEAGEYWNKYPKTDFTYSRHSKDRVEVAPGEVVMPNMSRKPLHRYNPAGTFAANKQTNTDSYLHEEDEVDYRSLNSYQTLATNNNCEENFTIHRRSRSSTTFVSRFLSVFYSIFTVITYPFYYIYESQYSAFLWFAQKLHKVVSKVMLLDTYILHGISINKIRALLTLCLLPLLFFGGWWLITGANHLFYGLLFNSTASTLPTVPLVKIDTLDVGNNYNKHSVDDINGMLNDFTMNRVDMNLNMQPKVEERIIKVIERITLQPPSAGEIAAELSEEQLRNIADAIKSIGGQLDSETIVEKVLESPSIQNVINNYNILNLKNDLDGEYASEKYKKNYEEMLASQKLVVDRLKDEINKVKSELLELEKFRNEDISRIIGQLRTESASTNAKLLHQLNRCCRRSFVQVESYVTKILKDMLGAPNYVANQQDMSKWLHSVFIAKQDLESRLSNLTHNLKSDFDAVIENNGRRIMDDVASKLSLELNRRIESIQQKSEKNVAGTVSLGSLTDEHIKKIVGEALAIYDADKTGLVDYALEPSGGQILSTKCTENYQLKTAVVSLLGIPLWYPTNTPRTVISPGVTPGECWAFQNFPGLLVVKLSGRVNIDAFTMEHINKRLSPNGKIDSAPRNFEVYGLHNETDREPVLLGTYVYDFDGKPLQYFPVQNRGLTFSIIELRILSNHGNPNYTCLYRFRVHGTLSTEPT